jgi:ribosomal protein S18 acetylase RimI-like enzyme
VLNILVRPARADDFPTLQRIYRRASLSNGGDRVALLAHPELLRLDSELISRGRTRVAVLPGTSLVGFASTSPAGDHRLELDDLFTDPRWRRRGVARALVDQIVSDARSDEVTRMNVIANEHARAFYAATGFVVVARVRTQLGVGIRMHLDIASRSTLESGAGSEAHRPRATHSRL